jgi:hypothetical protein
MAPQGGPGEPQDRDETGSPPAESRRIHRDLAELLSQHINQRNREKDANVNRIAQERDRVRIAGRDRRNARRRLAGRCMPLRG